MGTFKISFILQFLYIAHKRKFLCYSSIHGFNKLCTAHQLPCKNNIVMYLLGGNFIMKKTLLSVATVTALTGIASTNISANEYVPEEVQQNHDYTYNHETNGSNYSYHWYYGK